MKKRYFALALCLCLLCGILCISQADAAVDVCFIAANDQLLELNCQPYFSGGVTYVPYHAFTDYFKIYFSYFPETSTAMLYTSDVQLFFDIKNGTAYDNRDKSYSAKAVLRNGIVYVPATFLCNFFGGMACTYISGDDYGDIVRIKDSNFYLSDSQFLLAASELMQRRYEAYVSPSERPSVSAPLQSELPVITKESVNAYLSFVGLPDSATLSALRRYDVTACFFLTAEDVCGSPDTVRKLDCDGFSLGVLCSDGTVSNIEKTAALIYEATHTKVLLYTALTPLDEAALLEAQQCGFVLCQSNDINTLSEDGTPPNFLELSQRIDDCEEDFSLFLPSNKLSSGFLSSLLRHMNELRLNTRAPRETDF